MRWLKHWDYCVFGRDVPKASTIQSTYPNKNSGGKPVFGAVSTVDIYQRPTQRILMLHGPPGLGKTTLAHVAASLAGYEVIEINASDERSGTAAKDRIIEAVETLGIDRSGRRGKERCVILDECDGGDAVINPRTTANIEFRKGLIGSSPRGWESRWTTSEIQQRQKEIPKTACTTDYLHLQWLV
jgi:DNA polymerase III delta prime subunit